ncbi:MAG: serine hydrolase [Steroidobacteraceae bacterium]
MTLLKLVLVACCFVGLISRVEASEPSPSLLESRVRELSDNIEGRVSLYARNLDSGREIGINADEPVRTASTIKLPIACAVAKFVADGKYSWSDRLTIGRADKVSGSGVLADFSDDETISLRDATTLMIIVSDNTATNLILDRVGGDAVNDYLASLGLERTRVMRKIRGDGNQLKPAQGWTREGLRPENQRFGIGVSTPREMVRLLEMLERGQIVNADSSSLVLQMLERQQYKDGIGRKIEQFRVASKSGSLDALRSDVGIVHTPHGRIAIAVTVDGLPQIDYSPDNAAQKWIAEVSLAIIEGL